MSESIDIVWLGIQLRRVRKKRGLTLKKTSDETKITIATLSRIERGAAKNLKASTLVALSDWMGVPAKKLTGQDESVVTRRSSVKETPDIVELHLRADKKLKKETAMALAHLFRTAYEHYLRLQTDKE